MRTPAARSCASTAPAAVPSYISNAWVFGSELVVAPCGAAAALDAEPSCANTDTDGPAPSAMPVTAVAARKSLRDTVPSPGEFASVGFGPASVSGTFDPGFGVLLIGVLTLAEAR